MAIDPVCKMDVDEETAQWKSDYKGTTYYFCAPGCKASFDKDPEKYLHGGEHHEHHGHHDHH
jgi:YHS domain-containing protein